MTEAFWTVVILMVAVAPAVIISRAFERAFPSYKPWLDWPGQKGQDHDQH